MVPERNSPINYMAEAVKGKWWRSESPTNQVYKITESNFYDLENPGESQVEFYSSKKTDLVGRLLRGTISNNECFVYSVEATNKEVQEIIQGCSLESLDKSGQQYTEIINPCSQK